ncbi:hypothetical protein HXX76_012088 [Chlamydomonas incerta]|uniref:FAS1 domain-containing protein n=1 Tax=Chlamydomonas incerta TaxID=51695 RepID=A0A835SII4_CHLIN|nr:hypothetical protein HXX76_012088 [Chlamydomonas incerta]|eukprot:KAG2427763.1 hypothetical protein HXX76_012088 [Chlamydomonas incerta]
MAQSVRSPAAALVALCLVLSLAAASAQSTILQVLQANNLTLLMAAVRAAGLEATLNATAGTVGGANITLFAPTDAALTATASDLGTTPAALLGLGSALAPILTAHITGAALLSAAIPDGSSNLATLTTGQNLTVSKVNGTVTVRSLGSDAVVRAADLRAGGSVIHLVDRLLLPVYTSLASAVARRPELSSLLSAVTAAGLATTLSNPALSVTLFAPTNAALDAGAAYATAVRANLTDVLTYHVATSRVLAAAVTSTPATLTTLNARANLTAALVGASVVVTPVGATRAAVLAADIPVGLNVAANSSSPRSVIHVINATLVPFYTTVANAAERAGLTTLLAAVAASDAAFATALADPGFNGTVLAPSNAAFTAALTSLKLNASQLLADKDNLRRILNAHIIPNAAVRSSQLTNNQTIRTLANATLTVRINGTTVTFAAAKSSANVAQADVAVGNGRSIVHVIDYVLLPADIMLNITTSGGGGGGAAGMAAPSLLTLLSSALALLALLGFGKL